jgi:TonB family protein
VGAPRPNGIRLQRPYATFKISVDENGKVTGAVLEDGTGVSAVDDASAQAVRKWKFVPAAAGCGTVPATVEYAVPVGLDAYSIANPCEHDTTVDDQVQPEYPDSARNIGLGEVSVSTQVDVDAAGRVTGLQITHSSGNKDLDAAAMRAAAASTYVPAVHACKPVPGTYSFKVTFDPN